MKNIKKNCKKKKIVILSFTHKRFLKVDPKPMPLKISVNSFTLDKV